MKRSCPACGEPTVGVFRLLALGGLRRAECASCGARIGLSWASSLMLVAVGTWFPIAGALVGAAIALRAARAGVFIGGTAGLFVSGSVFAALFFRNAKLVVT